MLIDSPRSFSCHIVEIEREGKKVTAADVPAAAWDIDESFSEGKVTVYRLSGLDPKGVRFKAEMTARDCEYGGHGWPATLSDDLVIPTFQRLLAEGQEGAGLEGVPPSELYAARTKQLEREKAAREEKRRRASKTGCN